MTTVEAKMGTIFKSVDVDDLISGAVVFVVVISVRVVGVLSFQSVSKNIPL